MALDLSADDVLSFQALITVEEDLQSYVLEWPVVPDADGSTEAIVVVLQKRQGGFLLAVPPGFVPEQVLFRANAGQDAGPIGASTSVVVPGMLVDGGVRSLTGSQLEVVLVDVSADLVSQMRVAEMPEDIAMPFDADNPYVLPSPPEVLAAALDWIRGAGEETGLGFYTADGHVEDLEEEEEGTPPPRARPFPLSQGRPKRSPKAGATPTGKGKPEEKPKRVTTASLAASLDQLLGVVPTLSSQIQDLATRHQQLETRLVAPSRAGALGLSQPLSSTISPVPASVGALAKAVAAPPRTRDLGLHPGQTPANFQPEDLACLEEGKAALPFPDNPFAKAMMAQSQALTALVSQLTQSQQDPMMDLSSSSASSSTRGTLGRAKLQSELATHSGVFFLSVLRSMARRMQPTMTASATPEELWRRGVSGTLYMERFGGFGRHRDLGLILYQVMGILDFLQTDNLGAAKDAAALLAVGLDQAVLDGGRFDLAALLTLQEDPPFHHLHQPPAKQLVQGPGVQPIGRSKMGHGGSCLHKGTRRHHHSTSRAHWRRINKTPSCRGSHAKGQSWSKEEGEGRRKGQLFRPCKRRGGGVAGAQEDIPEMQAVSSQGGLESNPLEDSISFPVWAMCLPRWIMRSRTDFAWHLKRSFSSFSTRQSKSLSTTVFPLPLPKLPASIGGGFPRLSRRRARLLHVTIFTLNFVYLGRFPTLEELGRRPTCSQSRVVAWLRSLLAVCGSSTESFPMAPGRSGPELGACLFQLEEFVKRCPELKGSYIDEPKTFRSDPALLPIEKFPQLAPYRSLDADRLRLVGEGAWRMQDFLDSSLWLPFVEPAFLRHGLEIDEACAPNFSHESRSECQKLMRVWDARGLLDFFESLVEEGMFCRVFNAFKSTEVDRQIGDRRRVNMSEYAFDGPSQWLPPGPSLTQLQVKRYQQRLVASITDRRDFYHQASVTSQRSQTNMLPFSYQQSEVCHFDGFQRFLENSSAKRGLGREVVGDKLGQKHERPVRGPFQGPLFPAFRSLFQGDHLGVEFALCAHQNLLEGVGLLRQHEQILGRHGFPKGPVYSGLVIDDFCCISRESTFAQPLHTAAFAALARARQVYAEEGLLGSQEKDVVAQSHFKAASAEVVSTPFAVSAGCVPVGAPIGKRLALSTLSLRAASLPGLTPALASRLAGNWTSCLLYRRCLSAVVDGLFAFGVQCEGASESSILPVSRSICRELVVLSALSPLMCSNAAVDYLGEAFATDASLAKGAVVTADIGRETCEELWLSSEKKGHYVMLESGFREILKHVGEDVEPGFTEPQLVRPKASPLLYFDFVEICGGVGAVSKAALDLGLSVAPPLDLSGSPHYDLTDLRLLEWIMHMVSEKRFLSFLIEPPCTTFSPAAHPCLRSYKQPYGFCRENPRVMHGNSLAFRALVLLRYGKKHRAPCGLEQPRRSKMAWLGQ
eukprot:s1823_g8.t1